MPGWVCIGRKARCQASVLYEEMDVKQCTHYNFTGRFYTPRLMHTFYKGFVLTSITCLGVGVHRA